MVNLGGLVDGQAGPCMGQCMGGDVLGSDKLPNYTFYNSVFGV